MKTYKETKQAYKELVIAIGLNNIKNYHHLELIKQGHDFLNVLKASAYFQCSPQTAKYRK
jgi:hypothetical protein